MKNKYSEHSTKLLRTSVVTSWDELFYCFYYFVSSGLSSSQEVKKDAQKQTNESSTRTNHMEPMKVLIVLLQHS